MEDRGHPSLCASCWTKAMMTKKEKDVIEVLRKHISKVSAIDVRHESYPEELGPSTSGRLCDATWKGPHASYALEHTTIDSFIRQRSDDDRFRKVMGKLEKEWSDHPDDWIEFAIEVATIPTGINWDDLSNRIKAWLSQNVSSLPCDHERAIRISGVPFQLFIYREKLPKQGRLVVARLTPANLSEQRVAVIREALDKKIGVLQQYKSQGYSSILLIESSDSTLSSRHTIFKSLRNAYQPETHGPVFDQIYIATTGTCPWCIVPFKVDSEIAKGPQPYWPMALGYPLKTCQEAASIH